MILTVIVMVLLVCSQTSASYVSAAKTAGAKNTNSLLPLGDGKLSYTGPKKGYIYLCNKGSEIGGGAGKDGPWIQGNYWDQSKKLTVDGTVSWKNAKGTFSINGNSRVFTGNDLPSAHTTGVFPIQSSDDAYQYDRNPNSIKTQTLSITFPKNPQKSSAANCMGGEVGISLTGVAIFNGFDAEQRDAPAHELQDSYGGHPQVSGMYHYHSISAGVEKLGRQSSNMTLVGYAYDGFGIYGSTENGKKLTNNNLDECHGHSHRIIWDGTAKTMYHYHATDEFPYAVSCFKGKPVQMMASGGPQSPSEKQGVPPSQPNTNNAPGNAKQPPQVAINACNKKTSGNQCQFTGMNGESLSGTCRQIIPNTLACVPNNLPGP